MVESFTCTSLEIIGLYRTNYLNKFHVREMARLIKKSHVSLLPHLKSLEEKNILQVEFSGKNKSFSLNLDNKQGRDYISIAEKNISIKFLAKHFFIKKIYDETASINPQGCLILFGSYASGTQTKESDIDVFYLGHSSQKLKDSIGQLKQLYVKNIHFTSMAFTEFRKGLQSGFVKEVVNNHTLLYNHDMFINEIWRYYYERK